MWAAPRSTRLSNPGAVRPGATPTGRVQLLGGDTDFEIEHLALELVARVEAEHEEGESEGAVVFDRTADEGLTGLLTGHRIFSRSRSEPTTRVTTPAAASADRVALVSGSREASTFACLVRPSG